MIKMANVIRVIAIVVAYNNPVELMDCVKSILCQTQYVSKIICVDNSSDEYKAVNKCELRSFIHDGLEYIENDTVSTGSAKGFEIGMRAAIKEDYDFLWLNDQDGKPDKNCLRTILDVYTQDKRIPGIYAPRIIAREDSYTVPGFCCDLNKNLHLTTHNIDEGQRCNQVDTVATTGMVIHKTVISECGVYNGTAFFVGLEDIEYCLRAQRKGFSVFVVPCALYYHPDLRIKFHFKNGGKLREKMTVALKSMLPFNMGYVTHDSTYTRTRGSCKGSSYLNTLYVSNLRKYNNYVWSITIMIFKRAGNKSVDIRETLIQYRAGRELAAKMQREKDLG